MKANATFFLLLFSIFVMGPAVISYCDSDVDFVEFSMGEEEKTDTSLVDSEKHPIETLRISENLHSRSQKESPLVLSVSYWDAWYPETFSPPPEVVQS